MSLVIGGLSVRLVFDNPTLPENTDDRPQSRPFATALLRARSRAASLPSVTYTTYWDTMGTTREAIENIRVRQRHCSLGTLG